MDNGTGRREDAGGVSRKMRMKVEKQPVNDREYLDMDTDEEEFGKQDSPEPDEEPETEPEKPAFTEEQMAVLVERVKDLTTLAGGPEESDWSEAEPRVVETVREFFLNPAKTILTIFHDFGALKSRLGFPKRTDGEFTYFLRSPWQIYTPDDFLQTVIFGSIGDALEISTLKFFENIYAPIALDCSEDWPSVTRNEIFSNLHEFLLRLTDATYDSMGLTVLYVPREGTTAEDEEKTISRNQFGEGQDEAGLIERLERVARYWIRRVRRTLATGSGPGELLESPRKTILDEILHWRRSIDRQLTSSGVRSIVKKLERSRSESVGEYDALLERVRRMSREATSNINHLKLLEGSDGGVDVPDGIEDYATRVFLVIRFIGAESPFYRGEEKMTILCGAFGEGIVERLRSRVDLRSIFEERGVVLDAARKFILRCIACCDKVKFIYDGIVAMERTCDCSPAVISSAQRARVFSHVDAFARRCEDLVDIAESRIVFDRTDENITIRGPKSAELTRVYRGIEKFFGELIGEVKDAKRDVLDVASANWLDRAAKFRDGMISVENMTSNWIDRVFDDIDNVEEGIEALHGIRRFVGRANLREALDEKWTKIWKLFGERVESCSILLSDRDSQLNHHPSLSPRTGSASFVRSSKICLAGQYKMLTDASDWFGDCRAQKAVTIRYRAVVASLTEMERAL